MQLGQKAYLACDGTDWLLVTVVTNQGKRPQAGDGYGKCKASKRSLVEGPSSPFISFYLLLSPFIYFNGESQNSLDTSFLHIRVNIFHHSPVTTQSTVQKDKFFFHRFLQLGPWLNTQH
jgi:hypothetical protein